ncbi:MAG: response regulator transcription factor [Anaerolineae bacterium]|nr:response regulator transcription factor [Anaerolineae bacterium]
MSDLTRVLLVDDQQIFHDAITAILSAVSDIRLVGHAYSGEEAVDQARQLLPHLVLMDVMMPGMGGAAATELILNENPMVRVLAISSFRDYEDIRAILDKGAIGYLVKDALTEDLVNTIRNTRQGNTVLSPDVARVIFARTTSDASTDFGLTDRERQVLELLASGQTNAEIALALRISQPTVRFHFNNLLTKFRVETRSEALVVAAKNGLV